MSASRMVLSSFVFTGVLLAAGAANAAVTVIGGGLARSCYEAAEYDRPTQESLEVCNRALSEEALSMRDRAATFVNRGIVHMRAANADRAVADFDSALEINAELPEAYVNKGILKVRTGQDQEAIDLLTKGLSMDTSRPEIAYYTRAIAYELLGNTRAAYNDYKQAAALKPDWAEPTQQLSRFTVVRKGS